MRRLLGFICIFLGISLFLCLVYLHAQGKAGEKSTVAVEKSLDKSFKKIFPEYDNQPEKEVIFIDDPKDKSLSQKCEYQLNKGCLIYPVKKKCALLGFALIWQTDKGYKGPIKLMVGISPEQEILGLDILSHNETPNLGAKISTEEFQNQFLKRTLKNTKWMIEKDGGDIKAITGASFSSRAVTSALKEVLEFYEKNKDNLLKNK